MSDSKLESMNAATTINAADLLYLSQNSSDKKLSISTFLGNLPNTIARFTGQLVLGGNVQQLSNAGVINSTSSISTISNTGNVSVTINDGLYDGQLKIILCVSVTGSSSITSNISVSNITFNQAGQAAILVWYNDNWWPIGGTAIVTL
jgi:hypothetical protein